MLEDIIGWVAGALTTLCFVPQVLKVVKDKDTKAISLSMYLIYTLGIAMWLAYGVMILSWPIMIANTLTLVLALAIIAMKIRLG